MSSSPLDMPAFDKSSIQKWLDAGHKTYPKSQQALLRFGLTPNYVLKSLIALWCESNGIGLPQNQGKLERTQLRPFSVIFNLCIYQGNKSRAVKRGIVDPLTRLLKYAGGEMMYEALAFLAILSTNQEGKTAIAEAETIPVWVEIIRTWSPRNRETLQQYYWKYGEIKCSKRDWCRCCLEGAYREWN